MASWRLLKDMTTARDYIAQIANCLRNNINALYCRQTWLAP